MVWRARDSIASRYGCDIGKDRKGVSDSNSKEWIQLMMVASERLPAKAAGLKLEEIPARWKDEGNCDRGLGHRIYTLPPADHFSQAQFQHAMIQ